MGEKGLNTNLASEYYVLSMLYRVGAEAHLTLGNKKSIDLVVEKGNQLLTIDVKGLLNKSNFPIDNWVTRAETHFLVFVSFRNRVSDPREVPDVFIVPSLELESSHIELDGKSVIYVNPKGNRKVVEYNRLKKISEKYKDRWEYFVERKPAKTE